MNIQSGLILLFFFIFQIVMLMTINKTMKQNFKFLIHKIRKIMADINDFQIALDEANEATNEIAADIEALKQQIEQGGLSSLDEAAVLTRLQSHAARLKGIASENPATPPVEEPPVVEGE